MRFFSCVIEENLETPVRLDRYVSENLRLLSRSQIKAKLLKAKLNGKEAKLSRPVKRKDRLDLQWEDAPILDLIPQNISLDIVFENSRCIVVNKAQGMVVHPGAGNRQGTLVNALLFHKEPKEELKVCGTRPGIVHRLDKDTSGLIIAAFDDEALFFLSEQFKNRKVKKNYAAIVCGVPKDKKGCIETFIARDPHNRKKFKVSDNGRHAITYYKIIRQWQNYSLLLLRPKTGRTHQIRVHLRHICCPILADPIYGGCDKLFPNASLMLHSKKLAITLPGETIERIFSTVLPERFLNTIEKLNKAGNKDG